MHIDRYTYIPYTCSWSDVDIRNVYLHRLRHIFGIDLYIENYTCLPYVCMDTYDIAWKYGGCVSDVDIMFIYIWIYTYISVPVHIYVKM